LPHPALSKREGSSEEKKQRKSKVLSKGEDLGEAIRATNELSLPHPALSKGEGFKK
jgi:hypothetical protein